MTGLRDLEDGIARLEAASDRAEQAAREANAATKALEAKRKELRHLIETSVHDLVESEVAPIVRVELDAMSKQVRDGTNRIYDSVGHQIDLLINLTLGKPGRVKGKTVDLRPVLAERLRRLIDEILAEHR